MDGVGETGPEGPCALGVGEEACIDAADTVGRLRLAAAVAVL